MTLPILKNNFQSQVKSYMNATYLGDINTLYICKHTNLSLKTC
jgi:hypothetical protein